MGSTTFSSFEASKKKMFSGLVLLAASAFAAETDTVESQLQYIGKGCSGTPVQANYKTVAEADCVAKDCEDTEVLGIEQSTKTVCVPQEGYKPIDADYYYETEFMDDDECAGDHEFAGEAVALQTSCRTVGENSGTVTCNDTHAIIESYAMAECAGDAATTTLELFACKATGNNSAVLACSGVSTVAPVFAMVAATFFLLA